jgi:hypothetical protein
LGTRLVEVAEQPLLGEEHMAILRPRIALAQSAAPVLVLPSKPVVHAALVERVKLTRKGFPGRVAVITSR